MVKPLDESRVFAQMPDRLCQSVSPEGIGQHLRDANFQHARATGAHERMKGSGNILGFFNPDALAAHGSRHLGKTRVLEVSAHEAIVVEIHLVFLLRPPLVVIEYDRDGRNGFANASQHFIEAHAPGSIADVGDAWPFWRPQLGPHGARESVAAIAEAHGRKKRPRFVKSQIAVGYGANVANVSGHHGILSSLNMNSE